MAYSLLANYSVDSEMRDFVEKYDFYIFPIVNPDGNYRMTDFGRSLFVHSLTLCRFHTHP